MERFCDRSHKNFLSYLISLLLCYQTNIVGRHFQTCFYPLCHQTLPCFAVTMLPFPGISPFLSWVLCAERSQWSNETRQDKWSGILKGRFSSFDEGAMYCKKKVLKKDMNSAAATTAYRPISIDQSTRPFFQGSSRGAPRRCFTSRTSKNVKICRWAQMLQNINPVLSQ